MSTCVEPGAVERASAVRAFEAEVAEAAGVVNAAEARLVGLVVRALAEGFWEGWRIHTPAQWLMWKAGVSRSVALRVVALARRAPELPVTMAAFGEGRLSFDQAATVARYTPAEFEASVCELALSATVAQIATATRTYGFDTQARPSDAPEPSPSEPVLPPPDPEAARDVAFGVEDSGQWWARVRLPIDEGLALQGALSAVRDRLHDDARAAAKAKAEEEGRPTGDLRVPPPSWADALVGMAHAILHHGPGGAGTAGGSQVLVHLETPEGTPGRWMGTTHLGGVLPDELRRLLTCDGHAQIAWHHGGTPVNLGRTHRIVPRRIRRLIEHRDGGCRVPGCDRTWWLQVHHIVHWEDHGPTDTANLICLCSAHHRLHHQGLLGITGNADHPDGVDLHRPPRPPDHRRHPGPPTPGRRHARARPLLRAHRRTPRSLGGVLQPHPPPSPRRPGPATTTCPPVPTPDRLAAAAPTTPTAPVAPTPPPPTAPAPHPRPEHASRAPS